MPILGKDCKLYYSSTLLDGTTNTPATVSWSEIDVVRDVTLGLESGEADVTSRKSGGWRNVLQTLREGTIEFEMLWETGDAAFSAIQNAYMNGTEIAVAVMDGNVATSGQEGLASNMIVSGFSRNEPLEEGVTVSVSLRPSSQTEWYTVA